MLNATGSVRKAITENEPAARLMAIADRWNRTMLHNDSLWPLLKRLADPISNYWAVVVATREVGLMGARHRRCKFDDGPAAMCGPCVMRHRNETQSGALVFNPGECAGHIPGLNQVGVVDLVALETELLRF